MAALKECTPQKEQRIESELCVQETSASLDSTQRNMTGNSGRKQMMSGRGHELVLNP